MINSRSFQTIFRLLIIAAIFCGCSAPTNLLDTPAPNINHTPALTSIATGPVVKYGKSIHTIQGEGHISPENNKSVNNVHGVVTAVRADGFYMQDPDPDQNIKTSEGIFVFTESTPRTNIGDEVLVSGLVDEYYPGGIASGNLSITEIKNPRVEKLAEGVSLPAAVVIGRGGRIPPSMVIQENNEIFDPEINGLDFFESMESMLVQVNNAVVVGPTNSYKETVILADNGQDAGIRTPRGGIILRQDDFNPERIILDDLMTVMPELNVGDTFSQPLVGVLDYSFGNFKLQLTRRPTFASGHLERESAPEPQSDALSIASMNMQNLDPGDDTARFAGFARLIVENLKSPDILALDEIQDNNGATDDNITDASETYLSLIKAIQLAGGPIYDFRDIPPERNQDGGEPGGNIRVGFIFRTDRGIQFLDRGQSGPSASAIIKIGSSGVEINPNPGRISPKNPAFINSRKPIVGEFLVKGQKIFLIGAHLVSKGSDSPLFGRYQPPVLSSEKQRLQQAVIIQEFISNLLDVDGSARILVLGDLNDFQFSDSVKAMEGVYMKNLVLTLPENQQYSYVYDGNSQVLDQMLASPTLADEVSYYDAVHVNAEFAYNHRLSDHDPILARFILHPK